MNIAIIGAGLAGLTAAYELRSTGSARAGAEDDLKVDVYEATDRLGGKLRTVAFEAGPTDMGAEAFMARRQDAVDFFTELGLAGSLVEPSGLRSLVWVDGETRGLPTGGVMGIPSTSETVAHLVSEDTAQRIDTEADREGFAWEVGGDVNVGALVRERYGDEVVDNIVSSLLGGVYSCTADDLGVRATIPQLAEELDRLAAVDADGKVHLSTAVANLERSRREMPTGQGAVFKTFRDGYQEVYETLAEKSGADIYIDAFISAIELEGSKYRLKGGEDTAYDHVILAVPAPTAALLLKEVAPEASGALKTVKLANSAVVGMRFATDEGLPQNSGVLVSTGAEDVHAKAFTFSSRKWPHLAERGGALVRASFGRFGDNVAITATEDDLVDWALDDLKTITGFDGRAAGLEEIYVQRWLGGLPRFDENHLATVAKVRSLLLDEPKASHISLTGAWAGGVGVPAVIADARAAAAAVVDKQKP
ncbi:Protoporphyrinogen oxidase [Corynebacterium afermentans subsp. afermentans]|uniref:Coproporphyrinogen III oxidase n=1 Tax=Corynebacterium afermentans TaxID=38286 RepID=A0A9X8R362_9CORY|nr:protoporphyrinogen oxidase [Corynebacterium afermentans]OAA16839.1 protoporphyrinogen oxidase [Corynebacterium afermentans subsp. afermentans]WJY55883.1 Protoporphyrinogen oxidase [Corynebacterium afermentans subsp. afermentans]SIQ19877.1 oxygen-dependent protoporphyrinogen oxidase [Corynebacterium afermentans]